MKNLTISTRLYGTFGVLVLLLIGLAAMALMQIRTMNAATEDIADNWLPSVRVVNSLDAKVTDLRIDLLSHVLNTDSAAMEAIDRKIEKDRSVVAKLRGEYEKLISSSEEQALYARFSDTWRKYREVNDYALAFSRKNENDKARAVIDGDSLRLYNQIQAVLEDIVKLNSDGANASRSASQKAYATARNSLTAIAVLAVIVATAAALWLVRSITRPLSVAVG